MKPLALLLSLNTYTINISFHTVINIIMSMVNKQTQIWLFLVTDICDSIVSVTGLTHAFCGELVRFNSIHGDITGFVWNLEDNVCKVPLLGGQQFSGATVYCSTKLVNTRCVFVVIVWY